MVTLSNNGLRTIRLGIKSLLLHKLRSFLTILGLLFGVASVISMLAVGEGANYEALEQIKALGPTNVMVRSQRPPETRSMKEGSRWQWFEYGLSYLDAERIRALFPRAEHVVSVRETPFSLRNGPHWASSIVVGTEPEWLDVVNVDVAEGRWLGDVDLFHRENVVVLGSQAADVLFPLEKPLGKVIQAGPTRFTVIGVLKNVGREASPGGMPLDMCCFVPITTSRQRFGDTVRKRSVGSEERTKVELHEIKVKMSSTEEVLPAAQLLSSVLELGNRAQDDVKLIVPLETLRQHEATAQIFNIVLGSIAIISLLVGGIGIMNVMLATVTERTREIGIRRALGARRKSIVWQFLIETVVLSSIGGLLGVVFGVGIPALITLLSGNLTIVLAHHVALAAGISIAVGLLFGLYPAWRAAKMDPVEALRHE